MGIDYADAPDELRFVDATEAMCRQFNSEVLARELGQRLKDRKWSPDWLARCIEIMQEPGMIALRSDDRETVRLHRTHAKNIFSKCESPLEEVFLGAIIGVDSDLDFFSIQGCVSPCIGAWPRAGVEIFQQLEIGSYRADFCFTTDWGKKFIVELDGHKFHSSREAMTRDKSRDRELQGAGYAVLRYTYDEVWGNAQKHITTLHRTIVASQDTAAE